MKHSYLITGAIIFVLGVLIGTAALQGPGSGNGTAFAQQQCASPDPVPTGDPTPTPNAACNATQPPSVKTATPTTGATTPTATATSSTEPTTAAPATNTPVVVAPAPTQPAGGAGGAGISPPNTGSGPDGGTDGFTIALFGIAAAAMVIGAGTIAIGARGRK